MSWWDRYVEALTGEGLDLYLTDRYRWALKYPDIAEHVHDSRDYEEHEGTMADTRKDVHQ